MAHKFIRDLQEGDEIQQFFVVRQLETRRTKNGDPYWDLVLGDQSGTLRSKVWADTLSRCTDPVRPGDYVGVKGRVGSFNNDLQLTVSFIMGLERLQELKKEPPDFDPALLHPCTTYDRDLMWRELLALVAQHLSPPLQHLVLRLLHRHAEALQSATAARRNHHAYLGGLLEHTWFVARLALAACTVYREINGDLVLAGAILHDIGKIREIINPVAPDYSVVGQLVGHVVLGWEMVRQEAEAMGFPDPQLLLQLEHILLAHHGYQEFGSPVLPKTREALLVYYLDDLDAKMNMMAGHLAADSSERQFTGYHRLLQRELYKATEEFPSAPAADPGDD